MNKFIYSLNVEFKNVKKIGVANLDFTCV